MKKRLIIIVASVLVAAAVILVVVYRDSIFKSNAAAEEPSTAVVSVQPSLTIDLADDAIDEMEDPAYCAPSDKETKPLRDTVMTNDETALFSESILEMPLSKDSIPPIEDPKYTTIEQADEMFEDYDRMFVYEADDGVYVYPQRIMVWHEIVNETIDEQSVSITYCPLTSSVVAYTGEDGIHANNTYGTSGNLLNSNLVMYDRKTESNIPQILGVGVDGELNGFRLNTMPIHWAQWSDVVAAYDEAFVLTTETGFNRDYTRDPYGTYLPYDKWSYYQIGEPRFPLMHENDETYESVKVVIGVKSESGQIALDPDLVETEGIVHFSVGDRQAIAVYDNALKTVRVFDAEHNGATISLTIGENQLVDENGMVWSEKGLSENGDSLQPMTYFDVFWFAWHAYYPDTDVIA